MIHTRNERNQKIIDEFRANDGKVGGHFEGKTLLLLHTQGAKSGQKRINPLAYVLDGDRYVVIASKGGASTNPSWYFNLLADPHVELQDGPMKQDMTAREVVGEEKAAWWERAVAAYPAYADYQKKTDREIPVFVLEPAEGR